MNASVITVLRLCLSVSALAAFASLRAQSASTAVVEGRVIDAGTNNYLQNVRVSATGAAQDALTDATGAYRLANVPAGSVTLTVRLSNFALQTRSVTVTPNAVQTQDFQLRGLADDAAPGSQAVQMDPFTVSGRVMSAASAAVAEQRNSAIIKNVVAFEEFGDISGDGNPGEFLKYIPGINMNYGPDIAQFASVRGLPPNGTLVTIDGALIGSSTGDRQFEMTGAAAGNIERIEVTKTPTPDMPANSIGGAINIVGKSGFSRSRPVVNYAVYGNFNIMNGRPDLRPHLGKRKSPDPDRTDASTVSPGFDVSAIVPVNDRFAFTLAGGASNRYHNYDVNNTTWDLVNGYMSAYVKSDAIILSNRTLLSGSADWRITPKDTLRLSASHSKEDFRVSQNGLNFAFGTGGTGNGNVVQSRAGGATVSQSLTNYNSYRDTRVFGVRYRHDGPTWRIDANAGYTHGNRTTNDVADGTFSGLTASLTGLTLRAEGIDGAPSGVFPRITATNASGAAVNVVDGGLFPVTAAAGATARLNDDTIASGQLNVEREFNLSFPFKLKTGIAGSRENLDLNATPRTWAFVAPGGAGANQARVLGVTADEYSGILQWYDPDNRRVPATLLSTAKMFSLFEQQPASFTLNEAAAYTGSVNGSRVMRETILAGYLMADARLLRNRLRLVGGVRYERTADRGSGPKNDVAATYARDADGNILRNPVTNAPIRVTTNALELARIQYTRRAASSERDYDSVHPSLNAIYDVTEHILVRAGYSRMIARPAMSQILPGITLPDPTRASRIITANNTGLRPWEADNYDLSLEAYDIKGANVSIGVFRKEISDFFASSASPVTAELLADYGLGDEYLGYDLTTMRNGGDATLTGLEWSIRQSFLFLPGWAKGFQLFANGTSLRLGGPNRADFTQFSPLSVNYGIGLVRPRFQVKVNMSHVSRVRTTAIAASATIPAGTYFYLAPQDLVDISAEFRVRKWISVYGAVRNATQSAKVTEAVGPGTPDYARSRVAQRFGALYTMGVKGQF